MRRIPPMHRDEEEYLIVDYGSTATTQRNLPVLREHVPVVVTQPAPLAPPVEDVDALERGEMDEKRTPLSPAESGLWLWCSACAQRLSSCLPCDAVNRSLPV